MPTSFPSAARGFGLAALWLCVLPKGALEAQTTKPVAAPSDERSGLYAVTAKHVYVTPDRVLDDATVLVRDGRVVRVGVGIELPPGTVTYAMPDETIVPGFIDAFSTYGQPEVTEAQRDWRAPQYDTKTEGPYAWNEAMKTAYDAAANFERDPERAEALRARGFATVLTHRADGISRGAAAVVALSDRPEHEALLKPRAGHVMSFQKGSSAQAYPSSLMGMIALLRQTYLNGQWYERRGQSEERNLSLEAWNRLQRAPQFFAVGDKLEGMRALKIAAEFDRDYVLVGAGDEYQRAGDYPGPQRFVLPLTFPDAYDVSDPYDAYMVDYADMLHWELADANAAYLERAGHELAFTLHGLGEDEGTLFERLDRVRAAGLSAADVLRALTVTPARYIGMEQELGTLHAGKVANFVVLDEWPVDGDTKVYDTWVQGERFVVERKAEEPGTGEYRVVVGAEAYRLTVDPEGETTVTPAADTLAIEAKLAMADGRVTLNFPIDTADGAGLVRLAGRVDRLGDWAGVGYDEAGRWVSWSATGELVPDGGDPVDSARALLTVRALPSLPKPFQAFGTLELPVAEGFVVRGATVWTNEDAGVVEDADVYVVEGRIAGFGESLTVPDGTAEVDGRGKHLTAGIIDEHSHVAISRGVNEGTQESSAEVRIGDVINSEDVNLYRSLSGGVTAMQQLHGSANPIGGQNAVIKLRWGMLPEQLKLQGADEFIKFALGENVKQSNWGSAYTTRYPQTRMGVEQVFDDYFTRARAYAKTRSEDPGARRNLDLEAVAEILASERFITCHSYKQSEIFMLMDVAERHDFRVNTFTHILEGYKVADQMREHGVAASTFSDWWAYKFEVWDAIPQNGPIMHEQGVLTAFNSDDAELGRRLNQEAAKAVQFGNLSEEEAWKFVTLNPAKILHIDDRTGSIKVGKDADLVLWNKHPMSVYAVAEKTWVDGVKYFDREEMRARQAEVHRDRNRLAQAMLDDKHAGKRTRPVEAKGGELDHCDALHD